MKYIGGIYFLPFVSLYPRYEVCRGYIVFAFTVIMFVCLFVCKLFSVKNFSATTWVRILKGVLSSVPTHGFSSNFAYL